MGREAGHGCMIDFVCLQAVHQPSPSISLTQVMSGPRRSIDTQWELPLDPVSFWTHMNFGNLTSSGKEFLSFRVPWIFTALGPLREEQIF